MNRRMVLKLFTGYTLAPIPLAPTFPKGGVHPTSSLSYGPPTCSAGALRAVPRENRAVEKKAELHHIQASILDSGSSVFLWATRGSAHSF